MRDVLTLTLNPALDVSAVVPQVVAGPKLRCSDARIDPGGGGVNVSRAIRLLGGNSRAIVASGGVTGALLCDLLEGEGVDVTRLPVSGLTRQSFAVTDAEAGGQYRFVMPGPDWNEADLDALWAVLDAAMGPDALLVVSGSLPPGLTPDLLSQINSRARAAGARMLLDTSGDALVQAVEQTAHPFHVLRVDGAEADELAGRPLRTPEDTAAFGRSLIAAGRCEHAVMALGAQGTLGISDEACFFCRPPLIETVSAVGAGDSLVGAMALALARGAEFDAAVRFGTAAAGAAVKTPATALCDRGEAEALVSQISVEAI
ncbi:1-phosphofructokinase family hexose kinase [Fontisubflavum oceani]|uniref:1-phosphofructokinase family hexose kinase n=1 Tax=Fontisubflavum oceani TaxID=2978973 RepID=UPI0025B37962|nr:1-phosphofructokinase family hexose kinase [Fontisubflavum oceani]WJY20323.1 1-phosphofructokinase family hexose kinase [Fontisubflavum oceani]